MIGILISNISLSLILMNKFVSFCGKTIQQIAIKINNTESTLKQHLEKKEYEETKKAIITSEPDEKLCSISL